MSVNDDSTGGSQIPEPHEEQPEKNKGDLLPANLAETFRSEVPQSNPSTQIESAPDKSIYRRLGLPASELASDGKRYRIGTEIGRGANGRVCGAFDVDLQREVAVKYLIGEHSDITGFISEARITANLEHPNIPPVYDINIAADGVLYFTQRRVNGTSLGQRLRDALEEKTKPPLVVNDIITIMLKVCDALAFAHDRGIVHRDIKPENIMIGNFGDVVVVDWGTATSEGDAKEGLVGTPMYMSPEQARNETVSAQADIYAVGACLFHALTGRGPLRKREAAAFWQAKRDGVIDQADSEEKQHIPPQLLAIAYKAMAAKATDRYQSIYDFAADLKRYQSGQAVSVYADNVINVLWQWLRRNRIKAAVLSSFMLAIAVIVALVVWQHQMRNAAWMTFKTISNNYENISSFIDDWKILSARFYQKEEEITDKTKIEKYIEMTDEGIVLKSGGDSYTDLVLRQSFPGGVRMSWEVKPLVESLNLNVFVGADNRRDSFLFKIGSLKNPCYYVCSTTNDLHIYESIYRDMPLALNEFHRFVLERDSGYVKLWINGELLFDIPDLLTEQGRNVSTFGFDCVQRNNYAIRNIHIERRPPAELVSALEIGERFFANEHWQSALQQYEQINYAYPNTDMGRRAQLRIGQIQVRNGNDAQGLLNIEQFAEQNPDHPWALQAWYDLFSYGINHNKKELMERSIAALKKKRAVSWLRLAFSHIAQQKAEKIPYRYSFYLDESDFEKVNIDEMIADAYELNGLQLQLGIPLFETSFNHRALPYLLQSANPQVVLETYPKRSSGLGYALVKLGHYDEALKQFPFIKDIQYEARINAGYYDFIVANDPLEAHKAAALFYKGDYNTLRKRFPRNIRTSEARLARGEAAEILAEFPENNELTIRSLTLLGKPQEALAIGDKGIAAVYPLMALNQPDKILAMGWELKNSYCALIGFASLGKKEQYNELSEKLKKSQVHRYNASSYRLMFFQTVIQPFIDSRFDETYNLREGLWHALKEGENVDGGRPAFCAQYLLGDITEARFLAQSNKRSITLYLNLMKAMRAEIAGDLASANKYYTICLDQLEVYATVERALYHFLLWRNKVTAAIGGKG